MSQKIRADMYSNERIEQRAELNKIRVRLNEKEIENKFRNQSSSRSSTKIATLQKELADKSIVAGGIAPNFSINASIPGRQEIGGGFSDPGSMGKLGSNFATLIGKTVGILNGVKAAIELIQAFNVEKRYGYLSGIPSKIHNQLYPGEAVRVFTYSSPADGQTISIESIHAPYLSKFANEIQQTSWDLGSLPYLKNPPNSFIVERALQSHMMRPLHEFPTEHTKEEYRRMSDRLSKQFPDISY